MPSTIAVLQSSSTFGLVDDSPPLSRNLEPLSGSAGSDRVTRNGLLEDRLKGLICRNTLVSSPSTTHILSLVMSSSVSESARSRFRFDLVGDAEEYTS
jgi:hypothetical protein